MYSSSVSTNYTVSLMELSLMSCGVNVSVINSLFANYSFVTKNYINKAITFQFVSTQCFISHTCPPEGLHLKRSEIMSQTN